MYKVFVNEKKLSVSKYPENVEKKLPYDGISTIEIAIDLLQNTSCTEINIFGESIDEIWNDFTTLLKVVEAAGGIVGNRNNEILFIKRLGKWDLPKGKIEKGESLQQAALREVEEETGLQELILEDYINSTFHIYTERIGTRILKTTHWFKMTYTGTKAAIPQLEEGITEVDWKNNKKIKDEVYPATFKNIQLILNEAWNLFFR